MEVSWGVPGSFLGVSWGVPGGFLWKPRKINKMVLTSILIIMALLNAH